MEYISGGRPARRVSVSALAAMLFVTPVFGSDQQVQKEEDKYARECRANTQADCTSVTRLKPITVKGEGDSNSIAARSYRSGSKMDTDALSSSASVSVVTAKEIETRGAQDLEDVLSYTTGVLAADWGSGEDTYDKFMIRGFDETDLGTYRDGLPVRGFGFTHPRREPYGYERVEVLKGSNSSLFGLNAPGGLVNAVTKTPKSYRFGEVYGRVGADHDHGEVGTDFGDINKDGTLAWRVTAKIQDGAMTYDYSRDDRKFALMSLSWMPSAATKLTGFVEYNERNGSQGTMFPFEAVDVDPSTFTGEPDFDRIDTTERSIGWILDHDFGGGLNFHQVARYSSLDMAYERVYNPSLKPKTVRWAFADYSNSRQFGIDNRLQYDTRFGNVGSRTLVGAEYTRIKGDELSRSGYADGIDVHHPEYCGLSCIHLTSVYHDWTPELKTRSVYALQEFTIGQRWIATAGLRHDSIDLNLRHNQNAFTQKEGKTKGETPEGKPTFGKAYTENKTYTENTGRLGLTYKATDDLSVYANYSQSFNPPSLNLAPTLISNDTSKGTQYEVGVKYRPAGLSALFSAALFDLKRTNIVKQTGPTTFDIVGKVGVRGIEMEGKGEITPNLNLSASWSYWDTEIREGKNTGKRLEYAPRQVASLWLDYTLPGKSRFHDLTIGGGVRHVGQFYSDNENTLSSPGRTLVDLAVTYALQDNVDLALNVSNLFDKRYTIRYPFGQKFYNEGREIMASVRYRW